MRKFNHKGLTVRNSEATKPMGASILNGRKRYTTSKWLNLQRTQGPADHIKCFPTNASSEQRIFVKSWQTQKGRDKIVNNVPGSALKVGA